MNEKTSERLLSRYQTGSDSAAAIEIPSRYKTRLISLAKKKLMGVLNAKTDAEDISQETFATFFSLADRNEIRWQKQGDLWRLLAGIAINKVKQTFAHYAHEKRAIAHETQISCIEAISARAEPIDTLKDLVDDCIVNEKPLMKSILLLRLAGYTTTEIADRLEWSPRTIRRLIERLKTKIARRNDFVTETATGIEEVPTPFATEVSYSDFLLLRMIGEGSFAKVYLAKQFSQNRFVAVKAIRKKWLNDDRVRATFEHEVEILSQAKDSNIVRTYGLGKLPNGGCFLILEWIDGQSLSVAIEAASKADRARWNRQLHESIKNLHSQEISHGDLTPNNILINRTGDVRIVDFGLSRSLNLGKQAAFAKDLEALQKLTRILGVEQRV